MNQKLLTMDWITNLTPWGQINRIEAEIAATQAAIDAAQAELDRRKAG